MKLIEYALLATLALLAVTAVSVSLTSSTKQVMQKMASTMQSASQVGNQPCRGVFGGSCDVNK